jgi:adenylate kinase
MHLSTGDLLRSEVQAGTPLGQEAEAVMARGELVSDALVLAIVRERLSNGSAAWLLDGFPRNLAQAEALDALLRDLGQSIELVVLLDLDDGALIQRLLGRGRADDNEDVIRNRLEVYREQTAPLIRHYSGQGLLRTVEAAGTVEAVGERIEALLVD